MSASSADWLIIKVPPWLGYPWNRYYLHQVTGARLFGSHDRIVSEGKTMRFRPGTEWRLYLPGDHTPRISRRLKSEAQRKHFKFVKEYSLA